MGHLSSLREKLERPAPKIPIIAVLSVILTIVGIKIVEPFFPEGYKLPENATSKGMEKLTEANKLSRDFPGKIPGARRVDRYETPGARYCLVQIRQVHPVLRKTIDELKTWEKAEVILIQKDISKILTYLWERNLKTPLEVYVEGIYLESEEYCKTLSKEKKALLEINKTLAKDYLEKTGGEEFYSQAVFLLERERKVIILPAETLEGIIRAEIEIKKNRLSKVVLDNREDILLGKIAKNPPVLAITVYGSLHAWGGKLSFRDYRTKAKISYKDNIAKWNKNHPDKKFSLIEITPENLIEIPK